MKEETVVALRVVAVLVIVVALFVGAFLLQRFARFKHRARIILMVMNNARRSGIIEMTQQDISRRLITFIPADCFYLLFEHLEKQGSISVRRMKTSGMPLTVLRYSLTEKGRDL